MGQACNAIKASWKAFLCNLYDTVIALLQGTLLMAMANAMPVVSTPYHFALELVQDSRGLLIPFLDNGTVLAHALNSLIEDPMMRAIMVSLPSHFHCTLQEFGIRFRTPSAKEACSTELNENRRKAAELLRFPQSFLG